MKRTRRYGYLGLLLLLGACHSTGSNFNSVGVGYLKPGVSTLTEVVEFLEADPVNRYYRPDGSYMARWAHTNSLIPDGVYFQRELWMEFDVNDFLVRIAKQHNIQTEKQAGSRLEP
mgnify:CR=1 FL=1